MSKQKSKLRSASKRNMVWLSDSGVKYVLSYDASVSVLRLREGKTVLWAMPAHTMASPGFTVAQCIDQVLQITNGLNQHTYSERDWLWQQLFIFAANRYLEAGGDPAYVTSQNSIVQRKE